MTSGPAVDAAEAVAATLAWVERVVVGLDLCPFAAAPLRAGAVRTVVSRGHGVEEVLAEVLDEAARLEREESATTLLVVPEGVDDFDDFLDLFGAAEAVLSAAGHDGAVQLAAFHPSWVYDGADADDPANGVSRSPWPTLHLLRWADVARAVAETPDIDDLPDRNAAVMRALVRRS